MIVKTIVNSIYESCSYIIHEKTSCKCLIIDCGDVSPILEYVTNNNLLVDKVLLTHTHFDHIYGLNELLHHYPDCRVLTNQFGKMALQDSKKNLSKYFELDFRFSYMNAVDVLSDFADVLFINKVSVELIPTPGHDKSSMTYIVDNNLFSGDSFIPGCNTVTTFPNSNKKDAERSYVLIIKLLNGCKLYPGHAYK